MMETVNGHVGSEASSSTLFQSEDWVSLPELPTSSELNPDWDRDGEKIRARARFNDITNPYVSKGEYLENHYFLQREDGIANLRKSISDYKEDPNMMDDDDTCIYTKVFLKGYLMTNQAPLCRISFSTERAGKKIRWTNTRRLTPGTVVALSADNFESQCKVASIVEKYVEDQTVTIHLQWANVNDAVFDPMEELVMVESRHGFYEAMRHSLVGLQYVATTSSPLTKYLVSGSKVDGIPQHVRDHPKMDITPLLTERPPDMPQYFEEAFKNVDITGGIPSVIEHYTSLDDSQLQAVHRILTKEVAIIQGPPGTGKTFTSVQALRIMIQSRKDDAPIIIAAETNHAVDQILKQIIGLGLKVVRLGGRAKDGEVKVWNVHNIRQKAKGDQSCEKDDDDIDTKVSTKLEAKLEGNFTKNFGTLFGAIHRNARAFKTHAKSVFTDGLLSPQYLYDEGIITEEQYQHFIDDDWNDGEADVMREWLGESLCPTSDLRQFRDPMFDTEEIRQDDEVDGVGVEMEANGVVGDFHDGRLKGDWIDIDRLYGGSNPYGYLETDIAFAREIRRKNLWDVAQKFRGPIYEYWQKRLVQKNIPAFHDLIANSIRITNNLKKLRRMKDSQLIQAQRIKVIGCTTTGLSKYRDLIEYLQPRVLLVEEAAQSREAQIAAALLPSLQQLVLVGDHQQLAPHCSVPLLAGYPHYLCTSMFERLVVYSQLPFTQLEIQRRMIPDIRKVLNPFYRNLRDHPMVEDTLHRPPIPGMKFPLYFCHHNYPEDFDTELNSMYNVEEAEHIVRFAEYLIMNGTPMDKITILTFYRGQRSKIQREARKRPNITRDKELKVNTVDSYQGEENDIILLSLVRSNRTDALYRAGFVEDVHRGVVSISRARRGFYVFGNYNNLENATNASHAMWKPVREVFQRGGFFDPKTPGLPIYCEKHSKSIHMEDSQSWDGNHGGCFTKCREVFPGCGHPCQLYCHPMPHEKLRCNEPCGRQLRCGHACKMTCGDKCLCSVDCAAFQGIAPRPRQNHGSQAQQNAQAWAGYNAQADDRRLAAQQSMDGAGDVLIDMGTEMVQPRDSKTMVVDKFRAVTLTPNGTRAVGDQTTGHTVILNNSASTSPSKSTDAGQVSDSDTPTSSIQSSTVSQNNKRASVPKKPKVHATQRPGNTRTLNKSVRRRRLPVPVLAPPQLTLSSGGGDPSPTIAEWERRDDDDDLNVAEVVGGETTAQEQASNEAKNLINFD